LGTREVGSRDRSGVSITTLADKTNLLLVRLVARPVPDYFNEAIFVGGDPEEVYAYLYALALSWAFACPVLGLFGAGFAYVMDAVGGPHGNVIGAAAILFLCVFALVGVIDASRRLWFASAARNRYRNGGDLVDAKTEELVKRARLTYPSLVLQMLGGLLAATILILASW
jgi:hypothetical protein